MNLKKITTLGLLVLVMVGISPSIFAASTTHTLNDTEIQKAILVHINTYRMQHGYAPLTMNDTIVKEARKHSLDMAQHRMPFGHTYFEERAKRLHAHIKNSGAAAENVAYNYKDAQDVVKNWVRSPGHQRNIVGNYNLTGIGIARDQKGKMYFTQIFLKTANTVYAERRPLMHTIHRVFRY